MSVGCIVKLPVVGYGLLIRTGESNLLAKLEARGINLDFGALRLPPNCVLISAPKDNMTPVGESALSVRIAEGLARSKCRRPHKAVCIENNISFKSIQKKLHRSPCPIVFDTGAIVCGYVGGDEIYALVLKQESTNLICVHLVENGKTPVWETYGIEERALVGMLMSSARQVAMTPTSASIARTILNANGQKKAVQAECANCTEEMDELQTCGRCMLVKYCGKQCQRQHWKHVHKGDCVPVGCRGRVELFPTTTACPICLDEMVSAKKLPCGHEFHATCLSRAFDARCPLCRK